MIVTVLIAYVTYSQVAAGQTDAADNTTVSSLVTALMPPVPATVEALLPESVIPNETLVVQRDDSLYGDTVKLRQSVAVIGDSFTIIIDTKHALPAGLLHLFYIFVEQQRADPSYLWLHIWRHVVADQYRLAWRRLVFLNDSSPYALHMFNVSDDEFQVQQGDYLGWTAEDDNRIVSRDDDKSIPPCTDCTSSIFMGIKSGLWPPIVRDEPYRNIRPHPRQFVFSAAVEINRPAMKTTRITAPASAAPPVKPVPSAVRSTFLPSTVNPESHKGQNLIDNTDQTTAITLGVIFGIFGAVIIAIVAAVIWLRRGDCQLWSRVKTGGANQQDHADLMDSGSSTPWSAEYGDDVDSESATTSSSSDATGAGVGRHPVVNQAASVTRPLYMAPHRVPDDDSTKQCLTVVTSSHDNTGESICDTDDVVVHENRGFDDNEMWTRCAENGRNQLLQQSAPPSKTTASSTHCVSVELHKAPRDFRALNFEAESMI